MYELPDRNLTRNCTWEYLGSIRRYKLEHAFLDHVLAETLILIFEIGLLHLKSIAILSGITKALSV